MRYNTWIQIAGINIKIESDYKMTFAEVMTPFLINEIPKRPDAIYKICVIPFAIPDNAKSIFSKTGVEVYADEEKYYTRFHISDANVVTDIILERAKYGIKEYNIYIEPVHFEYFQDNFVITSYMALDELLVNNNGFILHASFIKWNKKGVLFTAPSGVGKSTQADLWHKYEKAFIINGDRVMLKKYNHKYKGYGSVFAGSSHIYNNSEATADYIIVLGQAAENSIRRLGLSEAFVKLYSQSLVNTWNKDYQQKVMDAIEDIIRTVPVYELLCTPDERAVETLKRIIL
ncbi:MAG: hypothetical protein ACI4DS_04515 [Eubacterium sp.]